MTDKKDHYEDFIQDKPFPFKIVLDTRENKKNECPYNWTPNEIVKMGLATADISISGLTKAVCIERKAIDDFVGCCGTERERFERELQRMKAYHAKCVILEFTLEDIIKHRYHATKMTPKQIINSIASWTFKYQIAFVLTGDAKHGEIFAKAFLWRYYEHAQEIARTLGIK